MKASKFMLVVGAAPILLAACSGANTERVPNESPNAENSGGLIDENAARSQAAATPPASSAPPPAVAAAPPATTVDMSKIVRIPEDTLHDAPSLAILREQVRSQIVYKTKKIPEAEYEQLVRPSIVDQLLASGFAQNDVDQILAEVDYSRRLQNIR